MAFEPVNAQLDLPALEQSVLERWKAASDAGESLLAKSLAERAAAEPWVFYDGPPTANGRPGLHHVWARAFKDLYPRFHTMRGRYVERKAGWDCHGLPVELEIEKQLGFTGKADIEAYGIERFNAQCRESVTKYVADWQQLTDRMGMWLDMDDAYWTMSNDYIESVWWLFRRMWDQGLISEGFKVVPYCGRCGTALSSHEVAQGYQDVTEASAYVRFPLNDTDADLVVWTTTPWTLISNGGAAVGPDITYVRVRVGEDPRDLILAEARLTAVLGTDGELPSNVDIVERLTAQELVGRTYQRPFDFLDLGPTSDPATPPWRVVIDDFVTIDDGTGIVHLAAAFGEVDREVSLANGLPVFNPVTAQATFDDTVPPYSGMFVKDADAPIIAELARSGRLVSAPDYTHSYPHCWRCQTPLVYYAKTSWFAQTSDRKQLMEAENQQVGWHPGHIKNGRFGDWLANNVDWALSRDRYWGTPIPVWRCDAGHDTCVGSMAELDALAGALPTAPSGDIDLHRPYVDDVAFGCPVSGCDETARRVPPVLDAWFDSGSMPSAQHHFPFTADAISAVDERGPATPPAPDTFLASRFPADFICEAIDQTRGWFYSLLAANTLVFGESPYRNVVCLAHVVDKDGAKMSKSKGNVIDPYDVFDNHGADALRWYFFSAGSPWTNRRVYSEGIDETTRQFILTLWNVYAFFVTYASIDHWEPAATPQAPKHVLDRWLRSRLHGTIDEVTAALESYDAHRATISLGTLVDDLSNWYVRRSRTRFWKDSDGEAYGVLYEAIVSITQMLAPFCPFITDAIYANLVGGEVHLSTFPTASTELIDLQLERDMAVAREVVALGRSARTDAKMRTRQPLRTAHVLISGDEAGLPDEICDEIGTELNVHNVEFITSLEGLAAYDVVPNFRTLGPRLGAQMPAVKQALAAVDGSIVQAALDDSGVYRLEVDGDQIELSTDDVQVRIRAQDDLAISQGGMTAVVLDLALDDELRTEGLVRELIRTINDLRKSQGFEISDRIRLSVFADESVARAVRRYGADIASEVLALDVFEGELGHAPDDAATVMVLGEPVAFALVKA
ncbi:MAG: isoleucine--tRNA ligase [Actinobacteria bacterium]|nr:isoleucine--tRNA ligase [Actinomycetota bacterium]MCB9388939.1 isoleucine--tRNA ligase [Acidimicrobiia bacterium]